MALETWIMHACMVGDAGGIEPACTDAPDGAPPNGERKDALDTVAHHTVAMRRCRAQVASVAAAAAASLGVKRQRTSRTTRPRHHNRRRMRRAARCLRRRTSCTARARTQRHRLVAARARAGPTWEFERGSTVACASWRQGAARAACGERATRRSMASGSLGAAPSSDAPGAGRSGAEARECAQMKKRYEDAHGFSSAGSPGG